MAKSIGHQRNKKMTQLILWPEIEAFHNVRKHTHAYPELCCGNMRVQYCAKVKLHGTNAGIQCHVDGTVVPQSRETLLSVEKDNAGFARWVKEREKYWSNKSGMVFYGEFAGKGVQKGVAASQVENKFFAVFAARDINDPFTLITAPSDLQLFVSGIPDTYVLPWAEPTITIDWSKPSEELVPMTEFINKHVMAVEECDPWVKQKFNIEGCGEGLVFFPVSPEHSGVENFGNLCFKAKGEKHRVVKASAAATVNPEVAASVDEFVNLVLTEARLMQGATVVNSGTTFPNPVEFDKRLTGKFVAWILGDVKKETQDELQASNLTFEQVEKALTAKARTWYLSKS